LGDKYQAINEDKYWDKVSWDRDDKIVAEVEG
jgi:hypothetical protein